ncbi:binding-protein-dependent transport systems inner membrane component [Paenibacillus sp. FSL H8-457]|nr:binding-protein-dependent transport systems inner membrane component [Paenibacillus sp. FSL H8-457]
MEGSVNTKVMRTIYSCLLASLLLFLYAQPIHASEPIWTMEQGLTIKALSISENGELVAVGTQNASAILLQRDGTQRFEFMANNVVTGVALLNDGRMLVTSDDRHLYMLSADGKELWKRDFKKMIKNLSATPDGKLAIVTLHNESLVHVLDEQGQTLREIPIGIAVKSAAVSPNGQWLAAGAANQYAYLFNPAGELQFQTPLEGDILHASVADNGTMVVGTSSNKAVFYSAEGSRLGELLTKDKVTSVHVTHDGEFIGVADYSGNYYVANQDGDLLWSTKEAGAGQQIRFSKDGTRLFAGSDKGAVFQYEVGAVLEQGKQAAMVKTVVQVAAVIVFVLLTALLFFWLWRKKPYILHRLWKSKLAYAMLLPSFTLLIIFLYIPAFSGLIHSLYDWNPGARSEFIGLDNFRRMANDPYVTKGVGNLLILIATGLFKALIPPLIVAELIYHLRSKRSQYVFRTFFVISMVIPSVGMLLVWQDMYDPNIGLVNQLLRMIGLGSLSHPWLGDPNTALWAIIMMGFPFVGILQLLVMYSGLIAIPEEVIEAARIDGAKSFRIIRAIHLPLLAGQFKLLIVLALIGIIQDFGSILIVTGGGPADSTYVPALQMYFAATKFNDLGYASALGVSMFAIIMVITVINMKFIKTNTD